MKCWKLLAGMPKRQKSFFETGTKKNQVLEAVADSLVADAESTSYSKCH